MKAKEAAELIKAMGDSLENDPSQFHLQVTTVGTMGISRGGGTGVSGVAVGGGIGYQSSASTGNVQVQKGQAAATEAILETAETLRELAEAVGEGDKRGADLVLDRLQKGTAVPAAIFTVASHAMKLAEITG